MSHDWENINSINKSYKYFICNKCRIYKASTSDENPIVTHYSFERFGSKYPDVVKRVEKMPCGAHKMNEALE